MSAVFIKKKKEKKRTESSASLLEGTIITFYEMESTFTQPVCKRNECLTDSLNIHEQLGNE